MSNINATRDSITSLFKPTAAQIELLRSPEKLNYQGPLPSTKTEASRLITELQTAAAMRDASSKQIGLLLGYGGRTLAGAKAREVSTQISFLECLLMWETADTDEQYQAAVDKTFDLIRQRFTAAKSAEEYLAIVAQQAEKRQQLMAARQSAETAEAAPM